jgi:TPR repeat protein
VYRDGEIVEKDLKKEIYHLEEAAIGGHPDARFNLACHEVMNRRIERAMKHFIIAANLGLDDALKGLKKLMEEGLLVSKDDFEATLRRHQAAVDATKSKQREEAYAFYNLSPEEQRRFLHSLWH